jgi:hypothetical protein
VTAPPTRPPGPEIEIDELEHQALDLLDELPCGAAWIAAQRAVDEVLDERTPLGRAALEAAILEAGEDPGRVAAAEPIATGLLMRLITEIAASLIAAARVLAGSESRGALRVSELDRIETLLNESPELSPAIAPAVETTGMILGLDRGSIAWALLVSLGERADASAPTAIRDCSIAIAERLQAARPAGGAAEISTPLRVFRSAAVVAAGPSIRARLLAADHGELLALAGQLVERHRDPATLVAAFDAARAALADVSVSPEPRSDRPKRRFTWVHLTLALIVLGLTVWHYWWR